MLSVDDKIKRGSRPWFNSTLKAIEVLGGEEARAKAVDTWLESRSACDLEHFERTLRLRRIAEEIRDPAAAAAVELIILGGDRDELERVLKLLSDEVISAAINAQGMDEDQIRDVAKRLCRLSKFKQSELSLRRKLRQQAKQGTARINLVLGLIGSDKLKGVAGQHATQYEIKLRNQQKARWLEFGEATTLKRGDEEVSMLTVMQASGKKKLAEVLTLTKGLANYAKAEGLTWAFLTLTAPPHMHPNPENGNNTWDGTTPDETHEWILNEYQKVEARLRTNHKIIISGLRVVEPHRDGCPHHHILIFARPEDMATIEAEFRKLAEWQGKGLEWRLNDGRAAATSYCFKYITKTISSVEQLAGEHGSVDAWRSTWGIIAAW